KALPIEREGDVGRGGHVGELLAAAGLGDREGTRRVSVDLETEDGAGRGADPLGEDQTQGVGEVADGVQRPGGVEVAGEPDGAAYVLLVHPEVEGTVAPQRATRPADGAERLAGRGGARRHAV